MATHSSILAWRIPWTEEPGGLQSMGSQNQTRLTQLSTHTALENLESLIYGLHFISAGQHCWSEASSTGDIHATGCLNAPRIGVLTLT